jgi:hypothetical protein
MPFTNGIAVGPFPQANPTISGQNLTLSVFLNSPARVFRAITDFTVERFIMDKIFTKGPTATGGAVAYDVVTGTFFFEDRDVQEIRPGSVFPILNGGEQLPSIAAVRKLGGEVMLTAEAIRRDNRPIVQQHMMRLANTIIRNVDATAVAALNAAGILTGSVGTAWNTTGSDPFADLVHFSELISGPDLGYVADTVLINPLTLAAMMSNTTLRLNLPREDTSDRNPLFGGNISGLVNLTFYKTNRVPAGTIYILQAGQIGQYSDEVPEYYNVYSEMNNETTFIHGARITVPYVTDPLACIKVTGVTV